VDGLDRYHGAVNCFKIVAGLLFSCSILVFGPRAIAVDRTAALRGCFGTYNGAPKLADGHVDQQKLMAELLDIHANTYHWLFRSKQVEFEDFKAFLPLAREKHIKVWVTLVPPSEALPRGTMPTEATKKEYEHWVLEFARLSASEPNFVAWSIDDFAYNLKFWTPEDMARLTEATHRLNPRFAFVPCCYYRQMTPAFVKNYAPYCDGILFPYRDDSTPPGNLQNAGHVNSEIKALRERFGKRMPIILDVYATAHSRLGASMPAYVEEVMVHGKEAADGVLVYCHQHKDTNPEKYGIIKRLLAQWSRLAPGLHSPKQAE
jgi:hypothetical protein